MAVAPSSKESNDASCSGARKQDGEAASETTSVQSGESSDRKDGDAFSVMAPQTQVFSARSEEYRLLFRLPPDEALLQDFNCALQENILLQGHMYLFVHHICFYSNIFGFETKKTIAFHEVTCVRKAKTAAIFPNAIEIATGGKKHFFGSFLSRDEAYRLIVEGWAQHAADTRFILDPQTLKSETNIQDIEAISERESGTKLSADDLSSSGRKNDTSSEELMPLPNGDIDTIILENHVDTCENGEANAEGHSEPLLLLCEDVDTSKVPEQFTMVAQANFPICMEEFFDFFISDQAFNFLEDFHKRCGDKDFKCTAWQKHEVFGYTRDVSFLHPVKVYLGAKFGCCQEVQKFRVFRNRHLVIETTQQITDVPYSDYFLVEGIWDVTQDADEENRCTLRVYSNVAFSKKTIFRGKIEQSTREECREVYGIWVQIACELLKRNVAKQEEEDSRQNICRSLDGDARLHNSDTCGTSEHLHTVVPSEIQHSPTLMENPVNEIFGLPNIGSSVIKDAWMTSISYLKSDSRLPLVVAVVFVAMLILMQMSIIVLLTRAPEVHIVSSFAPDRHWTENVEWLEKRFNYLREEMLTVETRLEKMRDEYEMLKDYIQSLERPKHKS
ncbi:C2 and GRAM domain-containing protein [Apostasia shenzhenica]|uniref:C2 and GRAM domain-containing protein n=1 Tax=Apostasia shenzhenica TaxID=1088818 RepID=A0A2I0ACT6_9ASPA|nr:C2 and GRAM domain-containing protein [Apostasia shenzhenica]